MKYICVLILLCVANLHGQEASNCQEKCSCDEQVQDCRNASLIEIPFPESYLIVALLLSNNLIEETRFNQEPREGPSLLTSNQRTLLVQHIDLANNRITVLKEDLFYKANRIGTLILDGNRLQSLRIISNAQSPLRHLGTLLVLSMRNNIIEENLIKDNLFALNKLETFDLTSNKISGIETQAFSENPNLQILKLSNNNIAYLKEKCFMGLSKLEHLDLSDNWLSTVLSESFTDLSGLKSLDMSRNLLRCIPEGIRLPSLVSLFISYNIVSNFTTNQIKNLPRLKFVNLTDNILSEPPILSSTTSLTVEVSYNWFGCDCLAWKSNEHSSVETRCTNLGDFLLVKTYPGDGNVCMVCTNTSGAARNQALLNEVCSMEDQPKFKVELAIAVGSGSVFIGILIAIFCILKRRRKRETNNQEQDGHHQRRSLREWRRRTLRRLQNRIEESFRRREEDEAVLSHHYHSVKSPSTYGAVGDNSTEPQDGIYLVAQEPVYSVVHKESSNPKVEDTEGADNLAIYCMADDDRNSSESSTLSDDSWDSAEGLSVEIIIDSEYDFPKGQTMPHARTIAKPIPKSGRSPTNSTPVALLPPGYISKRNNTRESDIQHGYLDFQSKQY